MEIVKGFKNNISAVIFNGPSSNYDSITMNIDKDVVFEITRNFNTTLRVYGVLGGVDYLLPVTNMNTGTTSDYAVYCSRYKVNSGGYTTFKFVRYYSEFDATYSPIVVNLIKNANETPIKTNPRAARTLDNTKINNTIFAAANVAVMGVRNSRLIGARVDAGVLKIVQSNPAFSAFTIIGEIANESALPKHMEVTGDNSVIIICASGKVYRTVDLINFILVLDIKTYVYVFGGFTQLDAYDNIVLIAEYNQPKNYALGEGGKVYLSINNGADYTTIFDLVTDYVTANIHIHAVKYDPYEGIIWLVIGDGYGNQAILYTLDMGANWYRAVSSLEDSVQMTSIIPLKTCVLFGSDARLVGVARYNRPECGTLPNTKIHLDFPIIFKEGWNRTSQLSIPVASRAYIDYDKSLAYFSFLGNITIHDDNPDNILHHGQIYATDGYDFYEIFNKGGVIDYGVIAVYGDPSQGLAFGRLGLSGLYVKIKTDVWTDTAQDDFTYPVLENAWVNYDAVKKARYYKDSSGVVHIFGLIKSGVVDTTAFTLPQGYRPIDTMYFPCVATGAIGFLVVQGNGLVVPKLGTTSYLSLDGISFRAEQ